MIIAIELRNSIFMEEDFYSTSQDILIANKKRPTKLRVKVLEILYSTRLAFSLYELKLIFKEEDRVSLYRALRDVEMCKLGYSFIDLKGIKRYAYLVERKNNSPIFSCTICNMVEVLPKLPSIDGAELLKYDYSIGPKQLVLFGCCKMCKNCNKQIVKTNFKK